MTHNNDPFTKPNPREVVDPVTGVTRRGVRVGLGIVAAAGAGLIGVAAHSHRADVKTPAVTPSVQYDQNLNNSRQLEQLEGGYQNYDPTDSTPITGNNTVTIHAGELPTPPAEAPGLNPAP